ncbi:hypothetical protein [Actinobaculum massiliense]|uniref:hypothetical protein n=1 Tax=Actinobaculum massiliense TaxID=202789 RepID=UPI0005909B0B|nr:hypothetical protein [Actinobaculum massiliense]MDK8319158.1 hypothetical protein [Actinobaculum massiliense]MDK8567535.1 hypothetical protein [Actinobaculum massiliense]
MHTRSFHASLQLGSIIAPPPALAGKAHHPKRRPLAALAPVALVMVALALVALVMVVLALGCA